MLDVSKYKWLDTSKIKLEEFEAYEKYLSDFLSYLNLDKLSNEEKNFYGQYVFIYVKGNNKLPLLKSMNTYKKELKKFNSKDSFKKFKNEIGDDFMTQYMMSGLMIIMCGTLAIFFLNAIITQKFLVAFSVDAIVGTIALLFLYRNLRLKYKIVNNMYRGKDILYLDIVAFILCILLKIVVKQVDLSLFILMIDYYFSKSKFKKSLNK